jgi:hypothetical protein
MRYLLAIAANALLAFLALAQQSMPPCQPFAVAAYTQALKDYSSYPPWRVSLVTVRNPADSRSVQQTLLVKDMVVQRFTPNSDGTCDVTYP